MKIPKELIFLGLALEIDIIEDIEDEDEDQSVRRVDLKGTSYRERQRAASDRRVWIMATDPDSMDAAAGTASLYLVRAPFTRDLKETNDHEPSPDALDGFYLWTNREVDRIFDINAPDDVAEYYGTITRIVYASDKKERRGKVAEYEHDFYEDGGEPPAIFFDAEDPDDATAAIIIGGTMSVNERGII